MYLENNKVIIAGELIGGFTYSHEVFGEKFYMTNIRVRRLSGAYDVIPLMVSDRMMDIEKDYKGCNILVTGQFRSYNKHEEERNKLILYVFAREITFLEEIDEEQNVNSISLGGYVCKEPRYRETTLGREIADVLLAVNRAYGKSDYIPCICWGRNARFVSQFEVGTRVKMSGRIQSREFEKKLADGVVEVRTAYEVSISKIEAVEGE